MGNKTQKERLPGVNVRQPLSLQIVIDFFNVAEIDLVGILGVSAVNLRSAHVLVELMPVPEHDKL